MPEVRGAVRYFVLCRALPLLLLLAVLSGCSAAEPAASPTPLAVATSSPTACMATLDMQATPAGCAITLDGERVADAPAELTVSPGAHTVQLSADGFAVYRLTVTLGCGEHKTLAPALYDNTAPELSMDAVPTTVAPDAGLKVSAHSTDSGGVATMGLFVDGRLIYQLEGDRLRHNLDTRTLAAGEHTLRVVASDPTGNSREASATFRIESADEAALPADATPTDAPLVSAGTATPVGEVVTVEPTLTPSPTAIPAVAVYEDQLTLTIDDYWPALYTDPDGSGQPYPLVNHDLVGPAINRTFQAIVLQNAYLELIILPELGGRIYQCRFLPTDQPLLYNNRVATVTHWGPTDQGWWLALGGIEFALPVEEHGYLTAEPWSSTVTRHGDGSATVTLQIHEQTRGLLATVAVTLVPGEAAIRLHTSIRNTTGSAQHYQFWTNAMLSPGRHGIGPELRISFPADQVIVHSRGDLSLPSDGSSMSWPIYAGRDLSSYGEWRDWLGFFGPDRNAAYMAVYDQATQIGMVHATADGPLPGAKVFSFGSNFDNHTYSEDGAQYIELWSGLTPTFWQDTSLAAGAMTEWDEMWYVVSQSGGVSFANDRASVYAWRDGGTIRITVAAPAAHRWTLVVTQDGETLNDGVFDVVPETPFRASFSAAQSGIGSPIHILILDSDGDPVLDYTF